MGIDLGNSAAMAIQKSWLTLQLPINGRRKHLGHPPLFQKALGLISTTPDLDLQPCSCPTLICHREISHHLALSVCKIEEDIHTIPMASPQSRDEAHRPGGRTVPSQRRAGRACLSCRARKVKCDVLQHGTPCQNCRINEAECLIARCRRGK
jgi:hypothetical protein